MSRQAAFGAKLPQNFAQNFEGSDTNLLLTKP